jgi:hypothetical protein
MLLRPSSGAHAEADESGESPHLLLLFRIPGETAIPEAMIPYAGCVIKKPRRLPPQDLDVVAIRVGWPRTEVGGSAESSRDELGPHVRERAFGRSVRNGDPNRAFRNDAVIGSLAVKDMQASPVGFYIAPEGVFVLIRGIARFW